MNMQFDAACYPYASRREVVYGRRGMVCTSQTLAAPICSSREATPWTPPWRRLSA